MIFKKGFFKHRGPVRRDEHRSFSKVKKVSCQCHGNIVHTSACNPELPFGFISCHMTLSQVILCCYYCCWCLRLLSIVQRERERSFWEISERDDGWTCCKGLNIRTKASDTVSLTDRRRVFIVRRLSCGSEMTDSQRAGQGNSDYCARGSLGGGFRKL